MDANYKQRGKEWERRCHINFFEFSPDGTAQALSQDCGIRVQGNYSRSDLIKGLRLFARKDYGEKRFEYDVFHGKALDKDGENLESFKTLTLRAGGNCAFTAKFNDTYWQARLGGNVPDYVKQAVNDCLKKGKRNHSYTSFRSTKGKTTGADAVQIGGNWFFGH